MWPGWGCPSTDGVVGEHGVGAGQSSFLACQDQRRIQVALHHQIGAQATPRIA